MGMVIEAVYENGVFKPLKKVNLKDGERVKIRIERSLVEIIRSYQEKFKLREEDIKELLNDRR